MEEIGEAVGAAAGASQAVMQNIRRRVKFMRRMDGSIFQAGSILTTLRRGIVQVKKKPSKPNQASGRSEM
jgi:hypothetical protein